MRVKICGVTNEADAIQAAELGADAIGLNFYKESPRYVTVDKAELIIRAIPRPLDIVGIFVSDYSPDAINIMKDIEHLPLQVIQVHGPAHNFPLHIIRAQKFFSLRRFRAFPLTNNRSPTRRLRVAKCGFTFSILFTSIRMRTLSVR